MAPAAEFSLSINQFPERLHPVIREIDDEGNGNLELDELEQVFTMYADMKKAAKEGSIAISTLPKELQPTLRVFDVDGDGTVAPLELGRAAELYKESKQQVKKLTKLAVVLLLLMGLMLGAITGLVMSVVEMSKETKTEDSGVTLVKGSSTPVGSGSVTSTKTLFDAPKMSTEALKEVKSLVISTATGELIYTITGANVNRAAGTVTFFSARGDTVQVTSNRLTVKAAAGGTLHSETRDSESRRRRSLLQMGGAYNPSAMTSTVTASMNAANGTAGPKTPAGWSSDCPSEWFGGDEICDCGCCEDENGVATAGCSDKLMDGTMCSAKPFMEGGCAKPATPEGWTCDSFFYKDGAYCDCACGQPDPDCDMFPSVVYNCPLVNATCLAGACVGGHAHHDHYDPAYAMIPM